MKAVLALLAAATVMLAAAVPTQAASPLARRIAALERTTKALKKENVSLKAQLKKVQTATTSAQNSADAGIVLGFCAIAVTGDAFQNTWATVNQVEGKSVFPAPIGLADQGACGALGVARQQTLVPPTAEPFSALLRLLQGRVAPSPFVAPWR